MKFSIITPTTGNHKLEKLLISINNQTTLDDLHIEHLIVVDGPQFKDKVDVILNKVKPINDRFVFYLPFNTGGSGYLGHKIYASISQLVNGDWVLLSDEDNYYDNDHIKSYYDVIKNRSKTEWLFCLRKIINDDGYVCNDDCESLGNLSNVFYDNTKKNYLIDTNCYCVSKQIMLDHSTVWNKIGTNDYLNPDRVFSTILMTNYHDYQCTLKYTLNYYTGNRDTSVKSDTFLAGNMIVNKRYGRIPWQDKQLYIIHFNQQQTEKVLKRVYCGNERPFVSVAFNQWSLNLYDELSKHVLLLDGYSKFIPSGSKVLVLLCHQEELPIDLLKRKDLHKIVYTLESPNIRHQLQWYIDYLMVYFGNVMTYWKPLVGMDKHIMYFPFIHRFDFTNPNDMKYITENKNNNKSICIVLENRNLTGEYKINGFTLQAQDTLRSSYAKELGKRIDCYGSTWESLGDVINYKPTKNRMLDDELIIDILKNYTFCLIIENCNAENYVSEKIYDALSAGCIPLYYGNNSDFINIPKDCYIDLKYIKQEELPNIIDNMDMNLINAFRRNIYKKRMSILEKVNINKFSDFVDSYLNDNIHKTYFISFGGGSNNYHDAVNRIARQAKEFNMFTKIFAYTETDLKNELTFWEKHKRFITENKRGFGYWIWKSFLIMKTLEQLNDGDILLYCDCGCELNINGKKNLYKMIEKTDELLIIGTNAGSSDNNYTKMDLINFMEFNDIEILNKQQMQGGCLMMKKCEKITKLIKLWYDICISNNYHLVDDSPSINKNYDTFIEHRHDQSVLSLLTKKYNLTNYEIDPTYFGTKYNKYLTDGINYPIWTCRNISGISIKDQQ
jgi:hypothetical protein